MSAVYLYYKKYRYALDFWRRVEGCHNSSRATDVTMQDNDTMGPIAMMYRYPVEFARPVMLLHSPFSKFFHAPFPIQSKAA